MRATQIGRNIETLLVIFFCCQMFAQTAWGSATDHNTPLEGTSWNLIRLGETPITTNARQNEAYIVLDHATHHVNGSGGCNRLTGTYELNGDHLRFIRVATTMMACAPATMDAEKAFLNTLEHVNKWKIEGQELELYDAEGRALARLEAGLAK